MTRRVALVVNALGTGGVERQMLALASGLPRDRFEVELIAVQPGGSLVDVARSAGVPTWCAGATRGIELGAVRRFGTHLRQRRFDVLMAANQYATLMSRAAVAVGVRPGLLLSAFHSSPALIGGGAKDRVRLALYRASLRSFDGLVYVSRRQRDEWQRLGFGGRTLSTVIHNGIDLARFEAAPRRNVRSERGWSAQDFVVGLCAALRPEKRPTDLVQAAALLAKQGVPVRLLFIGDGPERAAIEREAAAYGMADRVTVTGLQADVAPFIHACDVMTLVSASEAFSIAVLEAMACGKPLVLTEVGGAAEQIEEGVHGYCVPVGDPPAIADRLLRLWRDGSAARLGANARQRAQAEFSLRHMVDEYGRLFCGELQAIARSVPSTSAALHR